MKIVNMRCNRIENPLGFYLHKPCLSWVVESETAKIQTACQVRVALDKKFRDIVHDSGKRSDIDGIRYTLDIQLKPCTRYYWQVQVWSDNGTIVSPIDWFETAKMNKQWQARWITPNWEDFAIHPLLRKSFQAKKEVSSARLYICGLGLYEAEINGQRVGDEYLTPYCNSYDNWIQYQTFDVTGHIEKGINAIGVMLGNGWYKGRFGFSGKDGGHYGDRFALICELVLHYADGSQEVIVTDQSWKALPSYVLESGIYDGEVQAAAKNLDDWSQPSISDQNWDGVQLLEIDYSLLKERLSIPVRIKERLTPKVIITPKGETVLDFGQNMVGWVSFQVTAPKGNEIVLQYGEVLQDGCFSRENLRSAKAEFKYIADGRPAYVQPHFTFYGFRYVKIEGWSGKVNPKDFTGCVVYSDLQQIGNIETSNPLVNRLFLNALWGQKGNFLDVPTDCPQRDERMGWTGDAQIFSGTACFNMDCDAFFHKYLYDLAQEQSSIGGSIPHVVPRFDVSGSGSAAWSDAATVIPWNLYLHYGDKEILKQQFNSMKEYVDSIRKQDDGSRLWNTGFHFGDWLALDGQGDFNRFGGTPVFLVATAYYAYSAELTAQVARVLGKDDIAKEYQKLSQEVKAAFCEEFVTPRGRIVAETQTAYILALFMNLVPTELRSRIMKLLVNNLKDNNYYLKTGFVGTPYLLRVLSENGYNDVAYKLLLNEDFPSWLYAVKLGATTIWERWNSLLPDGRFGDLGMNSLNHYAYGSVVEWMYRNMCGLNPVAESPGFRNICLKPQPNSRLQYAKATLETATGQYKSGWQIKNHDLHYEFVIPFNAKAKTILPHTKIKDVIVNGQPLFASRLDYYEEDDHVVIILDTGSYKIVCSGRAGSLC